MKEATLNVGRSSSTCSACGRNAFPDETHHDTVKYGSPAFQTTTGFGRTHYHAARPRVDGCGAPFTAITTPYTGEQMANATKALRPDLPFLGDPYEVTINGG